MLESENRGGLLWWARTAGSGQTRSHAGSQPFATPTLGQHSTALLASLTENCRDDA